MGGGFGVGGGGEHFGEKEKGVWWRATFFGGLEGVGSICMGGKGG